FPTPPRDPVPCGILRQPYPPHSPTAVANVPSVRPSDRNHPVRSDTRMYTPSRA
ncbi:hypothetical protein FA95DRAFT_1557130, partial [Auriscalpium vulgare]